MSVSLSVISECKGVHRCQVLQLDGEEVEEEEEAEEAARDGGEKKGGGAEGRIGKASWEKFDLLPLKL